MYIRRAKPVACLFLFATFAMFLLVANRHNVKGYKSRLRRYWFEFLIISWILAPVNPPNVSARSLTATSISVEWSFNTSVRNVLGILRGFKVHCVKHIGGNYTAITVGANESSLTLVNLVPFTTYNVTVGVFTLAGETKSNPVILDTPQDGRSEDYLYALPRPGRRNSPRSPNSIHLSRESFRDLKFTKADAFIETRIRPANFQTF